MPNFRCSPRRGRVRCPIARRRRHRHRRDVWLDGHGTNLNWLISGADPLRPFAQSDQAMFINDRNQVLVQGSDQRESGITYYVLSPVRLEE